MRYRKRNVAFEHNHFMWAETFKSAVMVAMSPMVKTSNMTPVDVILTDEGRDAQASVMDAFSLWKLEHNLLKLTSMLSESDDKQVWRGLYDDEVVAVKKLRLHATTGPSFDSPHIIAMYGVVWSIPDDNNIQLVFEFMDGGNLRDYLAQTRHRSVEMWGEKLRYAMHLIEALVCLHDSSVIHRDVKSKHVLLNSAGDAKLTDFGWSRELDLQVLMTQGAGSFRWTAPEILGAFAVL
ncbi:hypothetical protein DYB32_007998 [Aphanomyces invadans]|uniref:Protein kinase domain-containing protein n=1 Tax=Aphanomyces invadans TaxID=157072 RepID=A0A418AMF3_9STRA|nr:hypothetical protein DYB32_007998 [Aphanomyces invadans]